MIRQSNNNWPREGTAIKSIIRTDYQQISAAHDSPIYFAIRIKFIRKVSIYNNFKESKNLALYTLNQIV